MLTHDVYEDFRKSVRRFAKEKVAPHARAVDKEGRPPVEALKESLSLGLPGLPFPEHLGGQNADMFLQVIATEELAAACASMALCTTTNWLLMAVVNYGSEEQQKEIIPKICSGEIQCAWGLTEPKGGSDLMGVSTKAVRSGNDWVINGTKRFITSGGWADWYMIFARTGEKTFSIFLVRKDDPGVSFGAPEQKMGMRGSPTADVILDNVRLPASRLLGELDKGGVYINDALLKSRLIIAAHALGIAQGAFNEAVQYTSQREQFGQPIARFQLVRGLIANMSVQLESSRSVLYRGVEMLMRNDPDTKLYASIAKIQCTNTAMSVTTDAVQLHGGYGYLNDYPVERMMRDAKVTQIWEGTNQIQQLMISKEVYAQAQRS